MTRIFTNESSDTGDVSPALVCKDLSFEIMAAVFEVHNVLGPGFLEGVYEKALLKELKLRGLKAEAQKGIRVRYKDEDVGVYYADVVVEDQVLLELKAVDLLTRAHEAQVLNYLHATGLKLGLLINFAALRVVYKRFVL